MNHGHLTEEENLYSLKVMKVLGSHNFKKIKLKMKEV